MYDRTDPRSTLSGPKSEAAALPKRFAGPELGRFYNQRPQRDDAAGKTWHVRGQNFVLAYSEAKPGGRFDREVQADEYVVILPDAERGGFPGTRRAMASEGLGSGLVALWLVTRLL